MNKTIKYTTTIFIIVCFSTLFGCQDRCNNLVPSYLLKSTLAKDVNYCELIVKACNKDEESIAKLSKLKFSGEYAYLHGEVLVKLIGILGEFFFVNALSDLSQEDRELLNLYILAGFEYGENNKSRDSLNNYLLLQSFLYSDPR